MEEFPSKNSDTIKSTSKGNLEKWITKETVTNSTSVKNEILASNITPWQLFESERKTGNVMKNFIKTISESTYEVNFWNNNLAEHNIGLSDLLWEEVKKVRITWEKNGIKYDMTWYRQWLKWWFYDEKWKYLPVFNNFKVEVLESYSKIDLAKKKEENEVQIKEILKSPLVEKFKNKYSQEQLEIIVRKAQEYSIDPYLLLAMRSTENWRAWIDFWVMKAWIDTFDGQLTMACRIIQNNANRYRKMTWELPMDWSWRFSAEFIWYLSNKYAPIGASNDPNDLNSNHLRNLLAFYWEYSGKRFDNIDEIIKNNFAFLKKWEVQMTSWEIVWTTTADALIANANEHIGKWYVWWWWRRDTDVTDCSGLVLMAMKEAWVVDHGYDNNAEGLSKITKQKSPKDVVRWDLVFLQNSGWRITHIEIATWPVINWQIPIIDSSKWVWWVTHRYQEINNQVLVGTPIFYKL